MKIFNPSGKPGEVELIAENADDNFLLGKLVIKIKSAQVYPPCGTAGRSLRFELLDLVRVATETPR